MLSGARLKTYSISGFLSTVQTDTESPHSCITSTKAFDKYLYIERLAPEEVVERIRRESGQID